MSIYEAHYRSVSWSGYVNVYILLFIQRRGIDRFHTLLFCRQLSITATTQQTNSKFPTI